MGPSVVCLMEIGPNRCKHDSQNRTVPLGGVTESVKLVTHVTSVNSKKMSKLEIFLLFAVVFLFSTASPRSKRKSVKT